MIDGQNASDRNVGFFIDGNYHVLDGFEIKNGPSGGITIWANNNQILNCNIHHNGNRASSSSEGQDGVYSNEDTSGNSYFANYIHHNGRPGIRFDHGLYLCGRNEVVINNVLLANAGSGVQVAGYTTVSNLKIYNNVMAYNGTQGIILWQAMNGVDIKNNILYANGTYGINTSDAHGGGVNIDHNLFFANALGHFNLTFNGSDVSYSLGSTIYGDPFFANGTSATFDAHLAGGSPAIFAGLNLYSSFTTDMAGVARPASGAWDLGTYKYGSSGPTGTTDTTPPAASLTAPANGATVSGSITVSCSASDDIGVVSVRVQCDGANLDDTLTIPPYTATLNTATMANGSHTLKAVVSDAAGNQTITRPITVHVANTTAPLPTVSVAATIPTAVFGTPTTASSGFGAPAAPARR